MKQDILITGGAGFIGSNLTRKLLDHNYNVIVYDNLSLGSTKLLPNEITFIQGDIRDFKQLSKAVKNIDTIVHLAAYGSVVDSVTDPNINFDINVNGTVNVLEAARLNGVKKFIFASTGGALIGEGQLPVNEKSLPKPISPYGASKLCGEAYCHAYAKSYGIKTISLRFANIYGPLSDHKKGVVTKFIKNILNGNDLAIYGDGSATRDFLYVKDLCNGIISSIRTELQHGSVLHLSSGQEIKINELAKILISLSQKNCKIEYRDKRNGEVSKNFADYSKAKQYIKFKPQVDIYKGLKNTYNWFNKNL